MHITTYLIQRQKIRKTNSKELVFLIGRVDRMQLALQSALLDDPNASHFGTRLRTFLLKNSPPDCFS